MAPDAPLKKEQNYKNSEKETTYSCQDFNSERVLKFHNKRVVRMS